VGEDQGLIGSVAALFFDQSSRERVCHWFLAVALAVKQMTGILAVLSEFLKDLQKNRVSILVCSTPTF